MKKLLFIPFLLLSIAGYSQMNTFGGIGLRVNDTTTYQTNAADFHTAGYYDIYFNNQATNDHWDIWNGSSYDHIFAFGQGSGGAWGSITGTLSAQTDLQTALNLKAPLASPTFTGTPTLPTGTIATTQTAGNSSTAVATTAFVTTADNLKANLANTSSTLTDGATITITGPKHTLTSDESTVTWTLSQTGDFQTTDIILNATSTTWTFPANTLCVVEGSESGDNTATLLGITGDHHVMSIYKDGTNYRVVIKNFGQ